MPVLRIDLRDGFADDAVVVRVDGREVLRRDSLSTRTQVGLAHSLTVEAAGAVAVEVALPKRHLSETIRLEVAAPRHLGVSIGRDGRLMHEISDAPFRYL
jgi:hypothetical protein